MPRPPSALDSQAERVKRFTIASMLGIVGVCCGVKVLVLASFAFSGAATASRSWARLALAVLAVLALAGGLVVARRRRCRPRPRPRTVAMSEADVPPAPGSNWPAEPTRSSSRNGGEELTIAPGSPKR